MITTDLTRDIADDVINDDVISDGVVVDDVIEDKEPRYVMQYIDINSSPTPSNEVEFVSSRGVHFASISMSGGGPRDVHCVREVLKFLIAIINPQDKYVTICDPV